ncbi:tetratricopeptide repeat protein [Aliiroseovarius subalbicans]|uniref:tetratricopeptide repeat protein n=1 Tax=Aliiroseovarius subalbicans TaxID=2925840 RepID=UPI001F5A539A|nr:tetratricopeptide repeat protein [Aliiroseovarius subalbicans]MCI2398079.1 tetratricopeptide repeat protein [Aliiroseovarius subalbicans]
MSIRALILAALLALPLPALGDTLDDLFAALAASDDTSWEVIENDIWREWSQSGSPAMDLLLERGRAAMNDEEPALALEHLTALIDHAPGFAEGWNARATAFFQLGQYGPALADLHRTLTLEPRHFGALSGLALILEEMGDAAGALAAYRAVVSIHPHQPHIKEAIARLDAATGKDI